jgi:hypothetical protein
MFEQLIARNARNTDPKIGSTPLLNGKSKCLAKS